MGKGEAVESLPPINPKEPSTRRYPAAAGPRSLIPATGDTIGMGFDGLIVGPAQEVEFLSTPDRRWIPRRVVISVQAGDAGKVFYAAAQSFPDDLRKPTETIEQQLLLDLPALALLAEGFSVTLKCIGGGVAKVLAAPGDKIEEQDSRNLDCDDENVVYRVVNRAWTLEPANLPDFHVGISALTSYREAPPPPWARLRSGSGHGPLDS